MAGWPLAAGGGQACGLDRDEGSEQLTDELLGAAEYTTLSPEPEDYRRAQLAHR